MEVAICPPCLKVVYTGVVLCQLYLRDVCMEGPLWLFSTKSLVEGLQGVRTPLIWGYRPIEHLHTVCGIQVMVIRVLGRVLWTTVCCALSSALREVTLLVLMWASSWLLVLI